MINSHTNYLHPSFRYDEYFLLKVSPLLWIAIVYSLRHIIVVGLSFVGGIADLPIVKHGIDPLMVGSDLPALLVILAMTQRRSGGATWARGLWVKGRVLLSAGFAAHIVLTFTLHHSVFEHRFNETSLWLGTACVLDGVAIFYLLRSKLVGDIFADFPSGKKL